MARDFPLHDHPRSKKASEGTREAKKGDVRKEDFIQQDGSHKHEFKGEYESVGSEPQPGKKDSRPADDPERIDEKDWDEMNKENDEFIKSGRKGPVPSFKAPNESGKNYEHWRLRKKRDVPTS